jgi:hypothetical protein
MDKTPDLLQVGHMLVRLGVKASPVYDLCHCSLEQFREMEKRGRIKFAFKAEEATRGRLVGYYILGIVPAGQKPKAGEPVFKLEFLVQVEARYVKKSSLK